MKNRILTLTALAITALALTHQAAAVLLSDDFNGATIDSGLWQTSTPFGDSSITESGGNAVFVNRGRLLSVASLPTSIDVTGRFSITGNIIDQLEVLTRTDGTSTNQFAEFDLGISFRFQIQTVTGSTANNIKIARHGYPGDSPTLVTGTLPLALNTAYDFRVTDDGANLALYINDLVTPFLTATDSTVIGNHLGIYNNQTDPNIPGRTGYVTQLDYVHVVPEPTTLLFGVLSALAFFLRRNRYQRNT